MRDDENLVTVAAYTKLPEAEAARLLLESRGITCYLADAEIVAMDWLISNAIGGIKLQVPESQVALAVQAIETRNRQRQVDDYGLARRNASLEDETENEPENASPPEAEEADATVDRAWRAALFGLVLFPPLMHLYSLWLILQLPWVKTSVSHLKRPRLYYTIALDAIMVVGGTLVIRMIAMGQQ